MAYKYKETSTSWNGLNVFCRKRGNILQITVIGIPDKKLIANTTYDVCPYSFLHDEFNLEENYIPLVEFNHGIIFRLYSNENEKYVISPTRANFPYGENFKAIATVVL